MNTIGSCISKSEILNVYIAAEDFLPRAIAESMCSCSMSLQAQSQRRSVIYVTVHSNASTNFAGTSMPCTERSVPLASELACILSNGLYATVCVRGIFVECRLLGVQNVSE
mmetsp:Transcript_2921/g.8021  ORF Transcript_2921/g.8021 Transcript_2921/m.8021 type:complete len:111 (-) Transcript_2921:332-664(-)